MGDVEDNLTRQVDEVEALASIYGDDWCVVDESSRIYCIKVTGIKEKVPWQLSLQVHLPEEYPSRSPPEYQLNCPWLRGDERKRLEEKLAQIFCENIGENIIYQWVEEVRTFLLKVSEQTSARFENSHKSTTTLETEDDSFDSSSLDKRNERLKRDKLDCTLKVSECPIISHGLPITDRRSTFQAHLAPVSDKAQVQMVMEKLCENKKISNATHNIMAYRISDNGVVVQSCDDDGETHAGSRMLHLLTILNATNVLVVVSRWFGGILLGPDRFKHINCCTRNILDQCGYLKDKREKKGSRNSKRTR